MTLAESTETKSTIRRVLFCEGNTDGTVGGSYFSLLFLVSGLDKSRYEPIVVFRQNNEMISQFRAAGIDTRVVEKPEPIRFRTPNNETSGAYRIVYSALRLVQKAANFTRQLPLAGLECALYLRHEKIDLVHLNNSILRNHEWMLGALLSGTKCLTHERGINERYSRLSVFFAKHLNAIACISDAVLQCLESYGVETRSAVTIYNGIDPSVLVPQKTREEICGTHEIAPDSILIGLVGNIKEWKGQETALRALPTILDEFPKCVCLFVGDVAPADRYYAERLDDITKELRIQNEVIFVGYTPDVPSYLAAFDMVLHTSTQPEPFGRVLIEAMAMKKPLIGAAAGAVPEIILDGKTGLLFQPGDDDSLAKSVLQILGNQEEASAMASRAYERLTQYFHIDENISRTQQLYARILEDGSPN